MRIGEAGRLGEVMGTGKIILKNIKKWSQELGGGDILFFFFVSCFLSNQKAFKISHEEHQTKKKQTEMLCKNDINYTNIN